MTAKDRTRALTAIAAHARNMRKSAIRMTTAAGSGHPAPSFSAMDMIAALYCSEMRLRREDPDWADRDRFVLSKGHAAPALYAALHEVGVLEESVMLTLRQLGSPLQGHPSRKTPGVDATTGSLGIGLSQAVGMAIGLRLRQSPARVFAMIGDGECDEGQVWEAALAAAHFRLANLTVFLDHNGYQVDGPVEEVMGLAPLAEKWRAFGWRVEEIDGHDLGQILDFLGSSRAQAERPSIAVARTEKGHGVSFVRGNKYHAKTLDAEEAERAIAELDGTAS